MEQILQAYDIPKETLAAITILYTNTKMIVRSRDGDTDYFDIVAVLQEDTRAPYLFIICLDYVLRILIDKIKENGLELTKTRSRRCPAKTVTGANYADDLTILANTPSQAETLLHQSQTWPTKWNAVSSKLRSCWYCYMDALHGRSLNGWRKNLTATTQECSEQYLTSPGGITPQRTNCTTNYLPSQKPSNLDESDTQDSAGEVETSS